MLKKEESLNGKTHEFSRRLLDLFQERRRYPDLFQVIVIF